MASLGPEPGSGGGGGGGPRVPASGWGPAPSGVLSSGEDVAPAAPEGQGSCRRRNVLTERERRKRISASCERLRSLLPHFDGRREDMASVLEMAVHFLRLSRALVPGEEPQVATPAVWAPTARTHCPPRLLPAARCPLRSELAELAGPSSVGRGSQAATERPAVGPGETEAGGSARRQAVLDDGVSVCGRGTPTGACSLEAWLGLAQTGRWWWCYRGRRASQRVTWRQDPPSCAAVREDEREVPDRRTAPLELPGLAPVASDPSVSKARDAQDPPVLLPRWPVLSQRPVSPLVSLEAQGWPGRAVPLGWGPASPEGPEDADGAAMPAPDGRPASGSPVEDSSPFLLTASPDWWLGGGLWKALDPAGPRWPVADVQGPPEGRGSPLDRAEPAFLAEPEPGLQLLQDSLLAQWGSDLGCSGLALREEADGSFPDVFTCCL
ncbi:spermatogenesis- and oogenesis-specific basic helix-loop-helix-containing protein 1 [Dasypus novemcinctus]|uniref:spermatogenesis- and oogenesis-specific basic helix-loop-helix-containing protein 1 n=1 Tax=Dasypus novemcinctus TaxID=9361 RepID=UPI0039C99C75